MSLLPQTMLPPSQPIGRVDENGNVTIDKNWWLLIYNLAQNILGNNVGLPASALIELGALDADASDADAVALRQGVSNALLQAMQPQDIVVSPSDLPDIARALLLAQDALLPDPQPQAQPVQSITVGGSPFTYTAPFTGSVAITSGIVSAISLIRQGTSVATGLTAGVIPTSRGDQVQVTYTATPTMKFFPQ